MTQKKEGSEQTSHQSKREKPLGSPSKDKGKGKLEGPLKVIVVEALEPSKLRLGHWWDQHIERVHSDDPEIIIAYSELPERERLLLPQVPRMQLAGKEQGTKEDQLRLAIIALNSLGHQI